MITILTLGCADPLPSVRIVSPTEGATVCGTPFAVEVDVQNYILVDFGPEVAVPGEGHVDIALNGQNRWMTPMPAFEIPVVEDGRTLIDAILVDGTHHAIVPEVIDTITVTVDADACGAETMAR